jgi:hypothetical protein
MSSHHGPWARATWKCWADSDTAYYRLTYTEMLDWLDSARGRTCHVEWLPNG